MMTPNWKNSIPVLRSQLRWWTSAAVWLSVVTSWLAGCSSEYDSSRYSGTDRGGTSARAGGGNPARAGAGPSAAGGAITGGANTIAATDTTRGAAGNPSTTDVGAGGIGPTTGGIGPSTGGTSGTTQAVDCPAYRGTGGRLQKPPSNDFEVNLDRWTQVSGFNGVSRVVGDGSACEGNAYMTCDGATRFPSTGEDGPAIDVLPYMVPGHSYEVSAALRFNPISAPWVQRKIGLSQAIMCVGSSEKRGPIQHTLSTWNWVRVGNVSPLKFPPAGCASVTKMQIYVETSPEEGALTIDVDDFRLVDVTDPTAGTGGTGGTGGIAGSAGMAGTAGSGV